MTDSVKIIAPDPAIYFISTLITTPLSQLIISSFRFLWLHRQMTYPTGTTSFRGPGSARAQRLTLTS